MKKFFTILSSVLLISHAGFAQLKVGLPAGAPAASSILDASNTGGATAKGFLAPQVALTATNAAAPVTAPATGLWVYNTATAGVAPNDVTPGYYYWNATQWVKVNTSTATGNDKNIYEGNGTLTGARTVTMAGNSLTFTGGNTLFTPFGAGAALSINGGNLLTNPRLYSDDTLELQSNANPYQFNLLPSGNIGMSTNAPTAKLDVNGTARIRTVNQVAAATTIIPLFADVSGNVVKSSAPTTFGSTSGTSSASINSGASGTLTTNFTDGGVYKAFVAVGDACGGEGIAEFYITALSANSYFAINGLGGILANGSTTKSPTFGQTSRTVITTTWSGKPGCAGGDDPTSFNYTLTISFAASVFTLTVTNNGNIAKNYTINLTRIN